MNATTEAEHASMVLDAEQQMAVDMCCDLSKRLVSITGEAGTGKTTIIKRTCDMLAARGISYALAAPTGKAARRIREATGIPATTVHKLLEFNRPDLDEDTGEPTTISRPARNASNVLECRVVIVDEYAMVSNLLHSDLRAAIGQHTCLRVFGDIRQLPPIEQRASLQNEPSPFARCLSLSNTITLHNVYRQADGNGILEAARRIARGDFFTSNGDIRVHFSDATLRKLYSFLDSSDTDWTSLDNQIISPSRKSDIGTIKLNAVLQARFNPDMPDKITLPRNRWEAKSICQIALNDKVVCNVNTYDLRDYEERFENWLDDKLPELSTFIPCPDNKQMLNGEVGKVIAIEYDGRIEIDFGDRVVELPPLVREWSRRRQEVVTISPHKNIELAYALTTHKCQGSEYDNVIYTMANCAFFNLNRKNFYTGVTRARVHVDVVTDQRAFGVSLKNQHMSIFKRPTA